MAEKKFSGAPFGTQTARFDVTGVHPKNKTPGTFTQIPYDKHSMIDQENLYHPAEMNTKKIDRFDNHLKNIRSSLKTTQDQIKEIALIKEGNSSKRTGIKSHSMDRLFSSISELQSPKLNENYNFPYHGKFWAGNLDLAANKKQEKLLHGNKDIGNKEVCQKNKTLLTDSANQSAVSSGNLNYNSIAQKNESVESRYGKQNEYTSFQTEEDHKLFSPEPKDISPYDLESKKITEQLKKDQVDHPQVLLEKDNAESGEREWYLMPKILTGYEYHSDVYIVPHNSEIAVTPETRHKIPKKRIPCHEFVKRKLGPGAYNTIVGGFSANRVEQKASGPGWARQLEVERLAALPHLLYKEQWEENKMLKRKLGPGSYQIKDFIQTADLKPRSNRGICENLAPRFEKAVTNFTPGPGTYGMGGVPQRAIEEKCQQSTSTKGMLESGDRKRNLPSVGSHLGPGTYRHKTCTEEMLNKVTSLKGPYELYSGDRNKPISEGYQAAPKLADLGPGQYEIGSFVDDLYSVHRKTHGAFGKMVQYPEVPTERIFLFSQAHYPKTKDFPGPGAYSMQKCSKPHSVNSPGFLSSAKRDDKISQKFFTRNFNPVGPGRYDIQKFAEAQDINGHSSVFKSKTGKPGLQMAKFLQERIRGKDVPLENRLFISEPEKPCLARAVTVL